MGLQKFLPPTQSLVLLATISLGDLYPGTRTLGRGPGMGLGLLTPEISLLNFYPPYMGEGPARFTSAPLLSVWMDVVSLIS